MLTLNQIVSQITNLAAAHNQIAESGVGDFAEWQAKERSYPILWVFHESTSVNQMEIAFSIRLICADRVIVGEEGDNTDGHEQEVLSDTLLVLLDFLAYFQQNHSQPYNVVTSATIDPFTERLNDRLAGNSVTIQIRQPFDWNKCQIPQTGAAIPPSVDGLTLYNFCDPAVLARLTDAQNACLNTAFNLPCADATFSIDGTQVDTVPSGADLDVSVELNGNPVTPTYNSGTKVIGVTGVSLSTLSVAVSDDTPNVGDSITITATATGFTPTDYYFFAKQGTALLNIGSAAGGVINWTVTLNGSFEIFAQAHDNTESAFNIGGEAITSQIVVITTNIQLYLDPFLSNIVAPTYPDLSGLGRNGTLVNSPTVVVGSMAPNDGGYIGLNGVNQYIGSIGTVADFAFVQNTRVFSMGGFFYIGSTTTTSVLIANSVTSSKKGFYLALRGDLSRQIQVSLTDGSGIAGNVIILDSPINAITSIGWYHIYATYTGVGGVAQIYLNGSPIATTVTGSAAPPTGNSTDPLRIGSESLNVFFMTGRIGPVQIYDTSLSGAQVQLNFNADRARYGL